MFCKKCGQEIMDEAVICVHCGCSTQEMPTVVGDAPSGAHAVLGFFFPIVGFILWLVEKDTKPLKAKSAGKGALIGFLLTVLIYIIAVIATTSALYY